MIEVVTTPKTEQVIEKISYDEFLRKYSGVHAEWVGGEVINLMTASNRHQDLVDWLIAILRMFVETYNLGWVRSAPFNMQMPHLERGREPDILFVTQGRLHIIQESNLSEAADLVIEIVSPESIGRDRGEKFVEYEAAGVREYWLIDPDRQQAEFYRLTEAGRYHLIFPGDEGIFRSEVLSGFWLRIDSLWQEPLPKVLDTVRELGLV
ncbi:MAG: Uma2 family endonuclease [Anaerolineae bacterium]